MTAPSKLFHSTSSGAGSVSALKVASLVVHRATVPSEVSTEYASPAYLTDPRVNPISRDPGRHWSREMVPCGIAGMGRGFNVVRSMTCSSLPLEPRSSVTARSAPSGDSSKPPMVLGFSAMVPSGVTAVHLQLAISQRQTRQSPPARSLST